jgi:hypothetical protein
MGLDMYIHKVHRIGYGHKPVKISGVKLYGNVTEITERVISWHKVSPIHAWFVKNVQGGRDDCVKHIVSINQLEELRNLIERAIDTQVSELLPPCSGLYFGSMDIDEYYWQDLEETLTKLNALLKFEAKNKDAGSSWFTYQASW